MGTFLPLGDSAFGADLPKPQAERVILCVWDGMRPDFIKPEITPNLCALAERGTSFANHHAYWITTTEVNSTVLATGATPSHSGVMSNREYRPEINIAAPVDIQHPHTMRVGDALSDGNYLEVDTVAELVQQAGERTVVAGTKLAAILHDRTPGHRGRLGSVSLFEGRTHPDSALKSITAALGKFPPLPDADALKPNTAQNKWTTRAVTEVLWGPKLPKYTVLWLGDPDYSQHLTAPGSETALAAIRDSDANLGIVIDELKKRGELERTDIFVASDHGFSTIGKNGNLELYFQRAKFEAQRVFSTTPKPGDVVVNNVDGSTDLYVIDNDPLVIQRLVDELQKSIFSGPIFTAAGLPGTFPIATAHLDTKAAPDIIFAFRWWDAPNKYGVPGLVFGDAKKSGFGAHGTLSKYEIHNMLIAAGPDIRSGFRNELPTGNIDVAPTILHLLGLSEKAQCDGRILTEALNNATVNESAPVTKRLEAQRTIETGTWKQYIETTTYAGKTYFDHGNSELVKDK